MTRARAATALAFLVWAVAPPRDEPEPPEVTLDPIVVTLEDPFPCSTDPAYRLAYQRLGAVCARLLSDPFPKGN